MARMLFITLVLGLVLPTQARSQDWQRLYPLEVGNVWEYQLANKPGATYWQITGFQRRTVTGDTTIGGQAYAVVLVEDFGLEDQPLGASRCVVRVSEATGHIEWQTVTGDGCDAPEEDGALDLRTASPEPDTVFVYLSLYYNEGVESWLLENPSGFRWHEFATDIGLLESLTGTGSPFDERTKIRLLYAEVGGEVYGSRFDSDAWRELYPLREGDVRQYESFYRFSGGQEIKYYSVEYADTFDVDGETYTRMIESEYSESLELLSQSKCGVSYSNIGVYKIDISGSCVGGEFGVPIRAIEYVGEADILGSTDRVFSSYSVFGGTWLRGKSFALDLGIFYSSYRNYQGPGGGTTSRRTLLYALADGVEYGVPLAVSSEPSAGGPPKLEVVSLSPNPFQEATSLSLVVPGMVGARLEVYDALGRRVLTRDLGTLPAGRQTVPLDGAGLAPGVYIVRVVAGEEAVTRRVVRIE